MQAREHNKLLSIFLFVQGGLQLFGGLICILIYGGMGVAMLASARRSQDQTIGVVFVVMAVVVGVFILGFASLFLLSAWKLLKEQSGARTWGIIACCVALLGFPLGTALGIYGLWFLFGEEGKQFYSGGNPMMYNSPPPPPHNWQ